jgi:hypothetical protein
MCHAIVPALSLPSSSGVILATTPGNRPNSRRKTSWTMVISRPSKSSSSASLDGRRELSEALWSSSVLTIRSILLSSGEIGITNHSPHRASVGASVTTPVVFLASVIRPWASLR